MHARRLICSINFAESSRKQRRFHFFPSCHWRRESVKLNPFLLCWPNRWEFLTTQRRVSQDLYCLTVDGIDRSGQTARQTVWKIEALQQSLLSWRVVYPEKPTKQKSPAMISMDRSLERNRGELTLNSINKRTASSHKPWVEILFGIRTPI